MVDLSQCNVVNAAWRIASAVKTLTVLTSRVEDEVAEGEPQ